MRPGTLALAPGRDCGVPLGRRVWPPTHAYVHFGSMRPVSAPPQARGHPQHVGQPGARRHLRLPAGLATTPNQRPRAQRPAAGLLLDLFSERPPRPPEPGGGMTASRPRSVPLSAPGAGEAFASCLRWSLLPAGVSARALCFRVSAASPIWYLRKSGWPGSAATLQRSNASLTAVATPARLRQRLPTSPASFLPPAGPTRCRRARSRARGLGLDPLEPVFYAGLLPFAAPPTDTAPAHATREAVGPIPPA